ncbi:ribonuclease H-like domain-containing protein [Candidatus Micrarchaeota archaeon]|nr:ribonuclease H-like domain-containing protein [Candidatus Micrarchaeota archaeon]
MSAVAMLLDADYVHSKRAIRLTLKAKGKTFRAYDPSFKPYFYLLARDSNGIGDVSVMDEGKQYKFGKMEEVERVLEGKKTKLFRLEVAHPGLVPLFREAVRGFGEAFESRIPFVRRYLIDKGLVPCGLVEITGKNRMIESITPVERVEPFVVNALAFDIETYNTHGLPDAKKDPLIMLSYADASEAKVLSWKKKFSSNFVESLSSEKEVLEEFGRRLREKKVDLLCSYNGDVFDLPYVAERAKATGAKLRLGRDNSLPKSRRLGVRNVTKIGGRIHFDVYNTVYFLDYIGAVKLQRLTLGKAYEGLLGKKKEDINKSEIFQAWDEGGDALEHLAKYSRSDAVACLELAEYALPLFVELARVTGSTLFDVSRFSSGQLVEALLLRKAFERNEVVPRKPTQEQIASRMSEPIKGAFVKSPQPGVYDNLVVFDFKSLYPSIIISHNIDPATLDCSCCENPHLSPQGYKFCKKRKGLIPSMLEEVLAARFAIQKEMKKLGKDSAEYKALYAKQWALKITANSTYGVLLYPRFRWYRRECGEAVTAYGRRYIQDTMEKAEKDGFSVLYADTDAAFLQYGGNKEKVLEFQKKVNDSLPETMNLELEDFYPRGIFVSKKQGEAGAKKKYALINEEGRIKIRGFELVRRDWSRVARNTQRQVLEILLKEGEVKKAA